MKRVAIGILGTKLDSGLDVRRWDIWRPTVSLFQHEDLLWDRLELLAEPYFSKISERVLEDVRQISPETEARLHEVNFGKDPWDLEAVYGALHDWARGYPFDPENEEYFIHITTGTHIAQISLFLLNESGTIPGKLIQTSPPSSKKSRTLSVPGYSVIDLDLSKYDKLSTSLRERAGGGDGFPEKRNRYSQRQLQPTDRPYRASGSGIIRADAFDRPDWCGEIPARPADLRVAETTWRSARKLR